MSAKQSDLSNPNYGYDIVIATTQESVNATLRYYLRFDEFPLVKGCFIWDDKGQIVALAYDDLLKRTNGTDPFKIDSWKITGSNEHDIDNVINSKLVYAFEASIGTPLHLKPANIPNIINFVPGGQSVNYSMICSQFTLIAPNSGDKSEPYLKFIQPDTAPWIITFNAPLKTITGNKNLPPDVQKQSNNLGPAFSVQELLVDLNAAPPNGSKPVISGVQPGTDIFKVLTDLLDNNFLAALKASCQPAFFYAFTKNSAPKESSTLILSDMKIEFSQYTDPNTKTKDNPSLDTLNYLCATNGNPLPAPKPFNWNWIEQSEAFDGVISISRTTFVNYLIDQMMPYMKASCYKPTVSVTPGWHTRYATSLTPGETPDITKNTTGSNLLYIEYTGNASEDHGQWSGAIEADAGFWATVEIQAGNKLIITQNLSIHYTVRDELQKVDWRAVDKTITDTYTLGVTQDGELNASMEPKVTDGSQTPPQNVWSDLNAVTAEIDKTIKDFTSTTLKDIPLQVLKTFAFPGGKAFAFKQIEFSDNQDLIAHITYVQPG